MVEWLAVPTAAIAASALCAAALLYYFARPYGDAITAFARAYLLLAVAGVPYAAAFMVLYAGHTGAPAVFSARIQVVSGAWLLFAVDELTARVGLGRGATRARAKAALASVYSVLALATPLAVVGGHERPFFPTVVAWGGAFRAGPLAVVSSALTVLVIVAAVSRCLPRGAPPAARRVGIALLGWAALGVLDAVVIEGAAGRVSFGPLGLLAPLAATFSSVIAAIRARERERDELHAALVTKTREADEANAALLDAARLSSVGRIAAGIAHEVNNPAAFILANLTQLRERVGASAPDETAVRALDDSVAGVRRIRDIVLALRALGQGPGEASERVRLDRLVETALLLAAPSVKHGAEIARDLHPAPEVLGRPGEIMHLILDLVADAIESLDAAGTVTVATREAGGHAELEVRATGPRAPRRSESVRVESARRTARSLGGTLVVTAPHIGETSRVVCVPAAASCADPASAAASVARVSSPGESPAVRARVLVIDDEPAMLRVLGRVVGRAHDVVLAGSAAAALNAAREGGGAFDVVLCDVIMADTNGVDLRDEIVCVSPVLASRFIFMTGGGLPSALVQRIRAAGCPVLEKPIEPVELLAHIGLVAFAGVAPVAR